MVIRESIIIREFKNAFLIIDTNMDTMKATDIVYEEKDRAIGIIIAQLPKPFNTVDQLNTHQTIPNHKEEIV